MTTTASSPLAQAAAILCEGGTAAQIAAEPEKAAEATDALYKEYAPIWAALRAIYGAEGARKAVEAARSASTGEGT